MTNFPKVYIGAFILFIGLFSNNLYSRRQFACSRMNSCAEACEAYSNGATYLDGGSKKDGIPCNSLCDKPCKDTIQTENPIKALNKEPSCAHFDSCFQACKAYDNGKLAYLDKDGDGIPCEDLCNNAVACIDVKDPSLGKFSTKVEGAGTKKSSNFATKKFSCDDFKTCAEVCQKFLDGNDYLDRDKNAIPCQNICDKPCPVRSKFKWSMELPFLPVD